MLVKKPSDIANSEITDPKVYLNRRTFLRAGVLAGTTLATAGVYRALNHPSGKPSAGAAGLLAVSTDTRNVPGFYTDEPQTPYEDITHYNNFYEFSTHKEEVADEARDFVTKPWSVSVEGLVNKPQIFDLDDLKKISPTQERVYRMRCVEGWSMVIPWDGFSLSKLLERVEPNSSAKFVEFQTLLDSIRMPNQQRQVLPWPYIEGLRIDEAMHPLTILATGLYGRELPPQDGAPVRLVVPWKYGFKGCKSIVKIKLTDTQPLNTWAVAIPSEYGFYANVNPQVDHPRWTQATELRIGDIRRRPTLMFNGYAEQVASLYTGMDLRKNF